MKPIRFKEMTAILTAPPGDEAQVMDLPVRRMEKEGLIVSCWRPSWGELLGLIVHRRVWFTIWSVNTHPPVRLLAMRTIFEPPPKVGFREAWAAFLGACSIELRPLWKALRLVREESRADDEAMAGDLKCYECGGRITLSDAPEGFDPRVGDDNFICWHCDAASG